MSSSEGKEENFMHKCRLDYLLAKKESNHYKYMYRLEIKQNKQLKKRIFDLEKEIEIQLLKIQKQSRHLINFNKFYDDLQIPRKRKSWSKIKCDCTKRQHISEYGANFIETIKDNAPQCKRAHLLLFLGDKTVTYSWKSNDFKAMKTSKSSTENFPTDDHCYAAKPPPSSNEDDEFIDLDYSSIFDSEGKWQSKHKRSIISVMDSFRISHEAYHELRHAGKGHFPPLHHIVHEKHIMSELIPYIKHPTVRIF